MDSSFFGFLAKKCDSCGKSENDPIRVNSLTATVFGSQFNTCPSCLRLLCGDCWPKYNSLTAATKTWAIGQNDKCPKCVNEGK